MREKKQNPLVVLIPLVILAVIILALPSVRAKINWRLADVRTRIAYALFPPEKEVFVPQKPLETAVQGTLAAWTPTPTTAVTATPFPEVTLVPTITPTPLPPVANLQGVTYVDQHFGWNMCAPANLTMALKFWKWGGTRDEVASSLKPFAEDKNVMLYEMANFARDTAGLGAAWRYGGTLDLVKRFIASGYPVVLETGTYAFRDTTTNKYSWMGHYTTVTGYDDSANNFIVQDSYVPNGANLKVDAALLEQEWRAFNFAFLVLYPTERQAEAMALLGDYTDELTANQIAYQRAQKEIYALKDADLLFAWYNRGTSLVSMQDYAGAADSYDEAFRLMAGLEEAKRPYRIAWYQTGPYFAYYYAGRYQDVIDLATTTLEPLERAGKPYLEESYYWRAKAELMLGQQDEAVADLKKSVEYHPNFQPALDELSRLGISP